MLAIPRLLTALALVLLTGALVATPGGSGASGAVPDSQAVCHYQKVKAFGYPGKKKCGSKVARCDWNKNGTTDAVFVISPGRKIFHAWRNSGGWKQMPGNGRADDAVGCSAEPTDPPSRRVRVYVTSSHRYWCSNWGDLKWKHPTWHGWFRC